MLNIIPTEVIAPASILIFVCGLMATFAIWSRRETSVRGAAVAGLLVAAPVVVASLSLSLGWPVPLIAGLNAPPGDWQVIGSKMVVGEGIYVLLDTGDVPRHYRLPWDKNMSDKLQGLLDGQQNGERGDLRLKMPPFEFSWSKKKPPEFYALPQPKVLPDKPRQREQPKRFNSIGA